MDSIEIIIAVFGPIIAVLLAATAYILKQQLDKISVMDVTIFNIKSDMAQSEKINRLDKQELINHLEHTIMPKLQSKGLEEEIAKVRTEIVILKEYQQKRISPALENISLMNKNLEAQTKKQKETDDITWKLYEVVKKLMEKSKNDVSD